MKKYFMVFVAVFVAVAIASPALAAVEFKYGGQVRIRYTAENNNWDGTDDASYFQGGPYNANDNMHWADQRIRLYFTFAASENLRLVTKFEMGTLYWGNGGGASSGPGTGGSVGADCVAIEVKNAYLEFKIPQTPTTAMMGVQSIVLLDSWIVDDDFSAAMFVSKLDPFTLTVGYIAGQTGWDNAAGVAGSTNFGVKYSRDYLDVHDFIVSLDYKQAPWSASAIFFYQMGNSTCTSFYPGTSATPARSYFGDLSSGTNAPWLNDGVNQYKVGNNNLFDLGFNITYKIDYLKAYVDFAKNLGSVDILDVTGVLPTYTADYNGWMVDVGATYYCGPWTANVGGYYTTGAKWSSTTDNATFFSMNGGGKINWYTTPLGGNSKYSSEIIGGGILGDDLVTVLGRGYSNAATGANIGGYSNMNPYWKGYGTPSNLWTVTLGGSYQLAEKTKLSASYWYFSTSEKVPVRWNGATAFEMGNEIGHELDFYLDQGMTARETSRPDTCARRFCLSAEVLKLLLLAYAARA
jgi:hypothetical protein